MQTSLLKTKLYIPPIPPEFVSRPRLVDRLDAGLHRRLTLISAPAGFGKTTLLSEWIQRGTGRGSQVRPPIVWVSLDRDDNDPKRFWTYFTAALETVWPNLGAEMVPMLESPKLPTNAILTSLVNEITKGIETAVLILDDYHLIEAQSIHEALTFLLDHLPSQLHLVIASRADPPLPLALLRGRGHLNELRRGDLRFTLEETVIFLNQVMKLQLSDDSLSALETRTEGWIASLQMAAVSMQGRTDITDFVEAFSGTHHFILDYLTEEVLQRQDQSIQSFLLQTSTLDRLSGPLCDAVTGQDDGQEKLEQLASANLFLVSLDDNRRWFRYHQLFSDLLRNQLNKTQPDLLPVLHQRASEWFEHEGLVAEAVHHALAAKNFEKAADLIESIAVPLITEGSLSAPRLWLTKLPMEIIMTRPWLCVFLASVRQTVGEFDTVESLLEKVESLLSTKERGKSTSAFMDDTRIRNQVTAQRAIQACARGDVEKIIELCSDGLKDLPDDQPTVRCVLTWSLGTAYLFKGELAVAGYYLEEAVNLGQATGNLFIALIALGYLADIQVKRGHLSQAAETNHQAIRLGTNWGGGEPLPATGYAFINLASIFYERNEVEEAIRHATRGIELSQAGAESITIMAFPALSLLSSLPGIPTIVTEALSRTRESIASSHNIMISNIVDAAVARLSLAQGDLPTAEYWATSHARAGLDLHDVPNAWHEFAYLTLVRVHIARGEIDQVPEILDRICQRAEDEERIGSVIEILVLQAIALQAQGKTDQALQSLERALTLGEPEGYIRIFLDVGSSMKDLLRQAAPRSIASNYINRLLNAFHDYRFPVEGRPSELSSTPSTASSNLLSLRELEVLRLMGDGASVKEIADQLFLSDGTVKKHINNIYSKLDVHKSTQAVSHARDLGLI